MIAPNQNITLFHDYLAQAGSEKEYYCHDAHMNGTVHSNNSGSHLDSKLITRDNVHDDHVNSNCNY